MSFDLIIFDFDGVVADSELLSSGVMADLLTEAGLPTTLDDVLDEYVGRRWRDTRPMIEARHGKACPDDFHERATGICHARAATELEPVPGLMAFLASRTEARCIASSSGPDWLHLGLDRFGIRPMFEGKIFSAAIHVERGKPFPDLFLHAARAMGVAPERALVIEDSEAGVAAGRAAGMTVVGLTAGGHARPQMADRLMAAGADVVAESYNAVAAFMDR
ncbi:haloacid dehalogenase [Brevundimonas sp. Leaf363]|uniref:HAD family hydrolase n=1 Tax=Brevundimonas sp. Leaf363 TaxID=1736353 RepID=UPI0006FE1454|nr:HAD-IA family hydrolase [Brevundimonas sp. Leaf363]KQS56273.1 haloacid dehalogenase [Brevundimonas sp. Leaf363]